MLQQHSCRSPLTAALLQQHCCSSTVAAIGTVMLAAAVALQQYELLYVQQLQQQYGLQHHCCRNKNLLQHHRGRSIGCYTCCSSTDAIICVVMLCNLFCTLYGTLELFRFVCTRNSPNVKSDSAI